MGGYSTRTIYAAGIIEQANQLLIVRPVRDLEVSGLWQFPRGRVVGGESPEAAMRRIAREALSIEVELVTGQPPFLIEIEGASVEMRYFFCGVISGEPDPAMTDRVRWIPKAHLREYDFDKASIPVVEWLLHS